MRLPFTETLFASMFSRACCVLAASALVGCATKNPLIDEPVAAVTATQQPAETVKAPPAAAASAASPTASSTAPAASSAATAAPASTASSAAAVPATASTPQQTAPAPQANAPAQTQTASAPSEAPASGVQTTKEKRLFGIFSPYRVDVQQGNFISQEQLAQLKPGMTPDQVKFVLGTPLLTDIFHANRWDYVFRLQKGNGEVISSRIAVHFNDNRVAKIDAGTLPSEQDYLSMIAGPAPKADAPKSDAPKVDAPKTESTTK